MKTFLLSIRDGFDTALEIYIERFSEMKQDRQLRELYACSPDYVKIFASGY